MACMSDTSSVPLPPKNGTADILRFYLQPGKNSVLLTKLKNCMPKMMCDGPFHHDFKLIYYIKDVYRSIV